MWFRIWIFLAWWSEMTVQLERRCSLLCSDFSSVADPDPNLDPSDPYVFGPPGSGSGFGSIIQGYESRSGSFYHQAKIVRKTLTPGTALWLLFDFLSLKNDVNVPSKSNKQKSFFKNCFLLASWRSMTKIAGSGSTSGSGLPPTCHGSATLDFRHLTYMIELSFFTTV